MPKPRNRTIVLVTAVLAVLGVAGCDATAAAPPTPVPGTSAPRQVTVVGQGQVDGKPDTLVVSVAIEATAPDAVGASNLTSGRIADVTGALAAQGIDAKDVRTTQVTLQPQYGGGDTPTIIGYQSSNSLDVKVRNIDTGPQVLAAIGTAGGNATRINSVVYSIADDSQLLKDARSRAFDDARNRADQYAELSGMSLGKILSISETGSTVPPTPSPRFDVAMEAAPLSPGQQTVSFSVTAVWELG